MTLSMAGGHQGMEELRSGTEEYLIGKKPGMCGCLDAKRVGGRRWISRGAWWVWSGNEVFAHPLPFNVIPQIDSFQENGYTKEEMKVWWGSGGRLLVGQVMRRQLAERRRSVCR